MILITGATGFLGRNLCQRLVKQGHQLRALVRPSSDTSFLELLDVELWQGDVLDVDSMKAAMVDCDYVVHTAAYFRFWGPQEPFRQTNVEGTRNVLEAALAQGIKKFIHISTVIVVGTQKANVIITEETPYNPYETDTYAKTKQEGERLALAYEKKGLPLVVLRLGALYGPHGHYAFNRLFFTEFLYNWRVTIHHGRHITCPCYIEDAAQAIELALEKGPSGEIYNISNQSISHREANQIISRLAGRSSWRINLPGWLMIQVSRLLELVASITKREPFYPKNLIPYVFYDWIIDSSKAQRELSFKPSTFVEGAKRTLAWYRSIGYDI